MQRAAGPRRRGGLIATTLCAALRLGCALAAASVTGLSAEWSAAAEARSTKIAVYVEGADAESVRAMVLALLPETLEVVDPDTFSAALKKVGVKKAVGGALASKRRRDSVLKPMRRALGEAKIDAVVIGIVRRGRGGKRLLLMYVDPIPGEPSVNTTIPMNRGDENVLRGIDEALGPTLKEIAPAAAPEPKPPPPEPKPVEPPPEEPPPPDERRPHTIEDALLTGELGFELGGRWFTYSDGLTPNLRPYSVFGAPMFAVAVEVYPLAGTTIPVAQDAGITVQYARAFALQSAIAGGDPIGTTYQRFGAGLRVRRALDLPLSPVLALSGGFRLLTFSYDAPAALAPEVPDVSYALLRVGVDGRVVVGPVAVMAGFEYLGPLASGDVYERFQDPGVAGIGLGGGIAMPLPIETPPGGDAIEALAATGLEVRLRIEYTRFFSSFAPQVGDPYVAGGALDELLGIRLAGAYVY